ncbi:MAG TPA: YbaB/EbfC family nucleoid-associated protein [Anaeromyxobacteraceae bacterium]|nr:YbaB/EbfC family nucleoid-associated protein [Anaeromyxobacteraceae bacterium]
MDIQFLMRQAKKIEKAMAEAKEKLAEVEVDAEAGGGLVQVHMNCRYQVRRIALDPKALEAGDKAMLEDLVAAAVNAAVEKARVIADDTLEKAAGGVKMPGWGL